MSKFICPDDLIEDCLSDVIDMDAIVEEVRNSSEMRDIFKKVRCAPGVSIGYPPNYQGPRVVQESTASPVSSSSKPLNGYDYGENTSRRKRICREHQGLAGQEMVAQNGMSSGDQATIPGDIKLGKDRHEDDVDTLDDHLTDEDSDEDEDDDSENGDDEDPLKILEKAIQQLQATAELAKQAHAHGDIGFLNKLTKTTTPLLRILDDMSELVTQQEMRCPDKKDHHTGMSVHREGDVPSKDV